MGGISSGGEGIKCPDQNPLERGCGAWNKIAFTKEIRWNSHNPTWELMQHDALPSGFIVFLQKPTDASTTIVYAAGGMAGLSTLTRRALCCDRAKG
jgi:hypothetical protein